LSYSAPNSEPMASQSSFMTLTRLTASSIRTEILAAQDATGLIDSYRHLAEQYLAEYDLDGWTVSDLVNSDDVNVIGKFNF
jgi:hypothetical protein